MSEAENDRRRNLRIHWAGLTEVRERKLMESAMAVARATGWSTMTRRAVARHSDYSEATVTLTFGSMDGLRQRVMAQAIAERDLGIVAQGLVFRDPTALAAPPALKKLALAQAMS